jgi:hypothetical protein
MDLLQRLIEGVQRANEEGLEVASRGAGEKEVKVAKLMEEDDVEAYLTTFERLMEAYGVPRQRWPFKLAPQLTGRVQQAYAGLTPDDAKDYDVLKVAILKRYGVNEESY